MIVMTTTRETHPLAAPAPARTIRLRAAARLADVLMLTACALMIGAAIAFRPGAWATAALGAWLTLAGIVALGGAIVLGRPVCQPIPARFVEPSHAVSSTRWGPLVMGLILLAMLIPINVAMRPADEFGPARGALVSPLIQAAMLVAGIALVTWGAGGGLRLNRSAIRLRAIDPALRLELAALIALMLLALILRTVILGDGVRRWVDEVHTVAAINRLGAEPHVGILTPNGSVTAFTYAYPLLESALLTVLPPTLATLRLLSALIGTLTIPAAWGLARVMFAGRLTLRLPLIHARALAWIAALMLAVYPPHVHFSRLALNNIVDPLLAALLLTALIAAMRADDPRRAQMTFAVGGMLLGLTPYFYEGGRLAFPPLALIGMIMLAWEQRRAGRGPLPWKGMIAFWAVFVMIALPVYGTSLFGGYPATPRLNQMGAGLDLSTGPDEWIARLRWPLWAFVQRPDTGWFYGGQTALLLTAAAPFFLLGVGHLVWRLRQPEMTLLAAWLLATLIGNALLSDGGNAARYVLAHPAIALTIAVGIVFTVSALLRSARNRAAWISGLIASGLIALIVAFASARYYFAAHLPAHRDQFLPQVALDDVMFRMTHLPPNTDLALVTTEAIWIYNVVTLLQFAGRAEDVLVYHFVPEELAASIPMLPPGRRRAFFVQPGQSAALDLLAELYPDARLYPTRYRGFPPETAYMLFYVD
jgi:uncharacterized membrane protein